MAVVIILNSNKIITAKLKMEKSKLKKLKENKLGKRRASSKLSEDDSLKKMK